MRTATDAAREIRASLGRRPPEIPSKYFYDDRGSELFEQITHLPEYYPTRTELDILEQHGDAIIGEATPRELVELGSGAGRKVRILLDAMGRRGLLERLTLLEINGSFLMDSMSRLQDAYPDLVVRGVCGDFERDLMELGPGGDRLVVFLAGTIGNLTPEEAVRFVGLVSLQMELGDAFLVGFDLVKDKARLQAAYNDTAGVTAAFNRNILNAVNDRFGADFDPNAFEHVAFYDEELARIEMRLRATRPSRVRVPAAELELRFDVGDEILTEVSCKYTRNRASAVASLGGLALEGWYTDAEELFALGLLRKLA